VGVTDRAVEKETVKIKASEDTQGKFPERDHRSYKVLEGYCGARASTVGVTESSAMDEWKFSIFTGFIAELFRQIVK